MADEQVENAEVEDPVGTAPAAACCDASDAATAGACALCGKPVCNRCHRFVNQKRVCVDCVRGILAEVEAEQATGARLPFAIMGGVVAAVLCGAAWTAMVVVTNMEIGYAAVGVGFATGYGVLLGARKKKGFNLQVVAVLCSILGLVLGKYFTVAHMIVTQRKEAAGMSYFDPRLLSLFVVLLPKLLTGFDALWAFIALRIAWRIPKPTDLRVTRARAAA